jgi:urease accessory protein UreF
MREFWQLSPRPFDAGRPAGGGGFVVSELGGSQISTLLETLPGIANVLRSPVADALGNVIRAGARLADFQVQDAEELVRYATRRGLLGQDEGDRLLTEVHAAEQRRADKAADRERALKLKARAKAKTVRPVKAVKKMKKATKGVKKR